MARKVSTALFVFSAFASAYGESFYPLAHSSDLLLILHHGGTFRTSAQQVGRALIQRPGALSSLPALLAQTNIIIHLIIYMLAECIELLY